MDSGVLWQHRDSCVGVSSLTSVGGTRLARQSLYSLSFVSYVGESERLR